MTHRHIVMFDEDDDAEDSAKTDLFANMIECKNVSNRETRKEREAKLKQMMEDDEGTHIQRALVP